MALKGQWAGYEGPGAREAAIFENVDLFFMML
jgi:hypothetical protein